MHVYVLDTGRLVRVLKGHMDTINGCVFNPGEGEMYSAGQDGIVLVWGRGGDMRRVWEV